MKKLRGSGQEGQYPNNTYFRKREPKKWSKERNGMQENGPESEENESTE